MTAGVVSYMLLCCGGGFAGLVSLTSSSYPSPYSLYSSELFVYLTIQFKHTTCTAYHRIKRHSPSPSPVALLGPHNCSVILLPKTLIC